MIKTFNKKTVAKRIVLFMSCFFAASFISPIVAQKNNRTSNQHPNILIIYSDDVGYGDVSCYGGTKVHTPNIDRLASEGMMFTNVHTTAATCTPARYSLLTGEYAWRKKGTGIADGDASLIIDPNRGTLPSMLQKAGYKTAVVGKWHLGLGNTQGGPDWNTEIKPGPLEIGFDYSFILPATPDRVPCVYVENHYVVGLDPNDPIYINYHKQIPGSEPTGKDHPELLKMLPSHGHDQTIVDSISRIGYMSGGKSARWIDENMADIFTDKAIGFMERNKNNPFFLYFAIEDVHVPRVPNPRFKGKSGLGPRGDALLELDYNTGRVLHVLDSLNLRKNTIVIFSSDNGPVLDDGYKDHAAELFGGNNPTGPFRGGKYSALEGGTRIPFIIRWPAKIKTGVSDALMSQVDLYPSFAALVNQKLKLPEAPDGINMLNAYLGKTKKGRDYLVEQGGPLALIKGKWKYIEPRNLPKVLKNVNIETGNDPNPQLYDISTDLGESKNVAPTYPEIVKEMKALMDEIKNNPQRNSAKMKVLLEELRNNPQRNKNKTNRYKRL